MPKKAETRTVYPVPGLFIQGVPTVEQELPAATAEKLVATGAFSFDPPPAEPAPSPGDQEA